MRLWHFIVVWRANGLPLWWINLLCCSFYELKLIFFLFLRTQINILFFFATGWWYQIRSFAARAYLHQVLRRRSAKRQMSPFKSWFNICFIKVNLCALKTLARINLDIVIKKWKKDKFHKFYKKKNGSTTNVALNISRVVTSIQRIRVLRNYLVLKYSFILANPLKGFSLSF